MFSGHRDFFQERAECFFFFFFIIISIESMTRKHTNRSRISTQQAEKNTIKAGEPVNNSNTTFFIFYYQIIKI